MYSIRAGSVTIMNDVYIDDPYMLIEPELTLEDNSAGKLVFGLTKNSVGYSLIQRMSTTLFFYSGEDILWEGRVVVEDGDDFDTTKTYTAEGALSYLNDTHQPLKAYNTTFKSYIKSMLKIHNDKVGENRQIELGECTVEKSSKWVTNWDKTLDKVKQAVEDAKAHMRVRSTGSKRYLDIYADYPRRSEQSVEFGKNLLQYSSKRDLTNLATVCIPLGKAKAKSSVDGQTEYLTCNPPYVMNEAAVSNFGWIEQKVNFDNIDKVSELKKAGQNWLKDTKYDDLVIEGKAVDLKRLGLATDELKLLDTVHFTCPPCGLDRFFPLTKIVLRPYEIDNCEYSFGENIVSTLTKINNATNNAIIQEMSGKVTSYDTSFGGTSTVGEEETVVVSVSELFEDMNVLSYEVFLTPYGLTSKLYVTDKTLESFTVVGDSNVEFYWEIRNITVAET